MIFGVINKEVSPKTDKHNKRGEICLMVFIRIMTWKQEYNTQN